jgi:hypothetical protein
MIPAIGQPEEIQRVTPLGVRFWDTLSAQPVGTGLTVNVYPLQAPSRRMSAFPNRSGIYVVQDLPGIRASEFGSGDEVYWSTVARKPFVVEVLDFLGRFQAFTFQVDLPFRGLLTNPCPSASPPDETFPSLGVPLYSALTRDIPSGTTVIYATLRDQPNHRPASWAMLEASYDGELVARGFADRDGRIALPFPYPQIAPSVFSPPGSPLFGNRPPLVDQSWTLDLHAFYTPWDPVPEIPDLCQIFAQSPVRLMETLSPDSPMTDILLLYGEKLILKSASQSFVWVMP